MSDCYECQNLRREKRGMGWIIAVFAVISILAMGKCTMSSTDLSIAERKLARAEEAEGAPIAGATGSFRVVACESTHRLCVLAALGDNGATRLYRVDDISQYSTPTAGTVVALERGKLIAISKSF